ncbi:MAG: hypothetical protein KDD69_00560 [Bdellovibrionales bacterium]|nr:hypothetical protein [Bdellovibrionales bacterium]
MTARSIRIDLLGPNAKTAQRCHDADERLGARPASYWRSSVKNPVLLSDMPTLNRLVASQLIRSDVPRGGAGDPARVVWYDALPSASPMAGRYIHFSAMSEHTVL